MNIYIYIYTHTEEMNKEIKINEIRKFNKINNFLTQCNPTRPNLIKSNLTYLSYYI
jgi:hypothetical protein